MAIEKIVHHQPSIDRTREGEFMEVERFRRHSKLTVNRTREDVERMSRVYGDPSKADYAVVGIEDDSVIIQDKATGITGRFSLSVIKASNCVGSGELLMGVVGNHRGYELPYTTSGGLSRVLSGKGNCGELVIPSDVKVSGISFGENTVVRVCVDNLFSDVFYDKFAAYAIEMARFCCPDEDLEFNFVELCEYGCGDILPYGFDSDMVESFYAEFSCSRGSFCIEYFIAPTRETDHLRAYAALSIKNITGTPIVENESVDMDAKYAATEARAYARLADLCADALGADIDIDNPAYFYLFD